MRIECPFFAILLALGCACRVTAQEAGSTDFRLRNVAAPGQMPLIVAKGTPIQIVVGRDTRAEGVGQVIHGRVVQPVYAFDHVVIPTGTEALGRIVRIEPVSTKKRTLAILNADFTPAQKLDIEFNELVLPNGKHVSLPTVLTPGSGLAIRLVNSDEREKKTVKDLAAQKIKEAKQQAKKEWETAIGQVKQPGKMHRLKRLLLAELPVHPQYIDAGTLYFAETQEALDFGSEVLTAEAASSIGTLPPEGASCTPCCLHP